MTDETVMNEERLLNVAKACRECKFPDSFSMHRIMNQCGTPACALGNYAAREDLQDDFVLLKPEEVSTEGGHIFESDGVATRSARARVGYDDPPVLKHFGITLEEAHELFGGSGCADAKTPNEAADYIERFVANGGSIGDEW